MSDGNSKDQTNDSTRESATERLFDFGDRSPIQKEKLVDDNLARVNYDEELSLQNIFLEKDAANRLGGGSPESTSLPETAANDAESAAEAQLAETANPANAPNLVGSASAVALTEVDASSALPDATLRGTGMRSSALSFYQSEYDLDLISTKAPNAAGKAFQGEAAATSAADNENLGTDYHNFAPVAGPDVSETVREGADAIAGQVSAFDLNPQDTLEFSVTQGAQVPPGFTLSNDGFFIFDPADAAYEHLNQGDSVVLTIPVTVTDPSGATDTSNVVLTVTGSNDAPVAGADLFRTVEEGAAPLRGQMTSRDADDGAQAFFSLTPGAEAPEGFSLSADGSFAFDPDHSAYNHLNIGDSRVLTIPVTVSDEYGASAPSLIQITVTGTNDAPIAGAAVLTEVNEGDAVVSGQMTAADPDDGATLTFSIGDGYPAPEGFVLLEDGGYRFDPDHPAYNDLAVGNSRVITVPVVVADEHGATDASQIEIIVHGTNDAPVAGASVRATVPEGGSVLAGRLYASDRDGSSAPTFHLSSGGDAPPGFSLNADGTYAFDPADAAYDHLNVGDAAVLTIPVAVVDNQGDGDLTQIQITVTGTNDAPVAGADIIAEASEGDRAISGQLIATDLDDGATADFAISDGVLAPAGFMLNADGSYSFDPADAAYDHLNVGDATVLTVPVTVTDEHGASDSSQITITVNGTNDGPVAGASISASVDEGAASISGRVAASDIDEGATLTFSVAGNGPMPEGFNLEADGTYTFDPTGSAYDHLNVGDSISLKVPVTVADEHGQTDTSYIQITVSGTNDSPVASQQTLATEEGAEVVNGQLPASDVDQGAMLTFSADAELPAGMTLNNDGSYQFDPSNAAYDSYSQDEAHTHAVPYTVTDEHGASASGTLYVGVRGANDKISMVVDTDPANNTVTENAVVGTPVGLVAGATDVDGDSVRYDIIDGTGAVSTDGPFAVDADSGVVTVSDPALIDFENAQSHVLTIQATSGDGSTSQQGFTIAVTDIDENVGPEANDDIGRIWVSETTNEVVENLQIGTFDGESAEVSDWGELIDGKAVFTEGDITVTTSVSDGRLTAYNRAGHVGFGIGNQDRQGLDRTETLTIEIEGGDANRADFTLSGLGSWFDETSRYATEVQITAYDQEGGLIETQGGYRESGSYEDTYSFETETPVQRFEITSSGSNGTFVVKNMTLTATDTISVPGHWQNVTEDGSITIDVLKNDSDADGHELTIIGVEESVTVGGVEVGRAEIIEPDGKQMIQFTPGDAMDALAEGESQRVSFQYEVSDGHGGSASASVNLTVDGVNDAPEVSVTESKVSSEGVQTIGAVVDVDGSISSSELAAEHGKVSIDEQGNINYQAEDGYEGQDVVQVSVTDDSGEKTTESISLSVEAEQDPPPELEVNGAPGMRAGVVPDEGVGENDTIEGKSAEEQSGPQNDDPFSINASDGEGWTESIDSSEDAPDADSPWTVEELKLEEEEELVEEALELAPDTQGVTELIESSDMPISGAEYEQW